MVLNVERFLFFVSLVHVLLVNLLCYALRCRKRFEKKHTFGTFAKWKRTWDWADGAPWRPETGREEMMAWAFPVTFSIPWTLPDEKVKFMRLCDFFPLSSTWMTMALYFWLCWINVNDDDDASDFVLVTVWMFDIGSFYCCYSYMFSEFVVGLQV